MQSRELRNTGLELVVALAGSSLVAPKNEIFGRSNARHVRHVSRLDTCRFESFQLTTKYFCICIIKEMVIAHGAPGIIDTDLDCSLSGVLF